jgi:hypothetical protein
LIEDARQQRKFLGAENCADFLFFFDESKKCLRLGMFIPPGRLGKGRV